MYTYIMPHQGLSERVKHNIQVELEAGFNTKWHCKGKQCQRSDYSKIPSKSSGKWFRNNTINSSHGSSESIICLHRRGNALLNWTDYIWQLLIGFFSIYLIILEDQPDLYL